MIEKKLDIPVITISTTGMHTYERGAEAAYLALVKQFCAEDYPKEPGRIGVLGANPLDLGNLQAAEKLTNFYQKKYPGATVHCYGMGADLEELKRASSAEKNIVVSPSGRKAAEYLLDRFGTPYEIENPLALDFLPDTDVAQKNVLILQQQVSAHTLRRELQKRGAANVVAADFFLQLPELKEAQDLRLTEEDQCEELLKSGQFDLIIADPVFQKMLGASGAAFVPYPQFSVSGNLITENGNTKND
jgi:nitrogenase molybdenum-cofactor synthesis protein NifE